MINEKTTLVQKILLVFLGIILTLALLETGLRLTGALILAGQEYQNKKGVKQKDVYKIMCVGESTTMMGGRYSYPHQLEEILNREVKNKRFHVINTGVAGTNTSAIVSKIKDDLAAYRPDMVIVMMGINDEVVLEKDKPGEKALPFFSDLRVWKLFLLLQKHLTHLDVFATRSAEERYLKEEIILHPRELWAYQELADYYLRMENPQSAEEAFRAAIKNNPHEFDAYQSFGNYLFDRSRLKEAEDLYQQAVDSNPSEAFGYQLLGYVYFREGKIKEIGDMLREAVKKHPRKADILSLYAQYCMMIGQLPEAKAALERAVSLSPNDSAIYEEIGHLFGIAGNYDKLEEMFEKAIALKDEDAFANITKWYLGRNEFTRAESFLKRILEKDPANNRLYRELANLYERAGNDALAQEYLKKAKELTSEYRPNTVTEKNYTKFVKIVQDFGSQLVCVQYPMRSVDPLKSMLASFKNIIFTDNEGVFKEAVRRKNYENYFLDSFAGDFGHCTPLGNRFLAVNIVQTILRSVQF